ncbi:MAG: hypothetical protein ACRDVE_10275 [Actinocrinis sp.]
MSGVALLLLAGYFAVHIVRSDLGGNADGISVNDYQSTRKGQSESSVTARFGQPLTQQQVEYPDPPSGDECIYYFDRDGAFQGGSTFRFCFRDGVLDFKDGSGADFFTP